MLITPGVPSPPLFQDHKVDQRAERNQHSLFDIYPFLFYFVSRELCFSFSVCAAFLYSPFSCSPRVIIVFTPRPTM